MGKELTKLVKGDCLGEIALLDQEQTRNLVPLTAPLLMRQFC